MIKTILFIVTNDQLATDVTTLKLFEMCVFLIFAQLFWSDAV